MPICRRLQVFLVTHAREPLSLVFLHPTRCFPSSPGSNLGKLTRTQERPQTLETQRSAGCPHSGAHLAGRESGTSLTGCASILRGEHPTQAPASHVGSTLIPVLERRRGLHLCPKPHRRLHTCSGPGEACSHRPPTLTVWGSGCTCLSVSHSFATNKWKLPDPVPGQTKGTPFLPGVNPARPVGPSPGSRARAAPSATPRPRSCRAGGKGRQLRETTGVLSPPGVQPLPAPPAHTLPAPAAVPAQDPGPRDPAPCPSLAHAQCLLSLRPRFRFSPAPRSLLGGPLLYATPSFKGPETHHLSPGG